MQFLMLRNVFEDTQVFMEVFKPIFKNISYEENEDYITIFFTYDNNDDIIHTLNALEGELMGGIHAYISLERQDPELLKRECDIARSLLVQLPLGIYTIKSAILKAQNLENRQEILDYILTNAGISQAFIQAFADNNLNVSQASKEMFIHRNTLIYKLNKLKTVAGFDLTNFKDAYILYSLLDNK